MEIAANLFNALSIILAGINSVHTWWVGIVGCGLFGYVFYQSHLYADVTLQVFFIVTSIMGWKNWTPDAAGKELVVRHSTARAIVFMFLAGVVVALGYGWLLHHYTDAYAPFLDSTILAFSVLGQFLLMQRRYESWWAWLLVNTIAVPLYYSRGLQVTALLYSLFWINAVIALVRWRKLLAAP